MEPFLFWGELTETEQVLTNTEPGKLTQKSGRQNLFLGNTKNIFLLIWITIPLFHKMMATHVYFHTQTHVREDHPGMS